MPDRDIVKTTCPRDCYDACGIAVIRRDGVIAPCPQLQKLLELALSRLPQLLQRRERHVEILGSLGRRGWRGEDRRRLGRRRFREE